MRQQALPDAVRNLAATPSFYGLVMWVAAYLIYYYGPIPWNRPTASLWIVFFTVAFCFLFSTLFSLYFLNRPAHTPPGWWLVRNSRTTGFYFVMALHAVGFVGVGTYISDFGRSMGDIAQFQQAFVYQSYLIRQEAEGTTSYGFQISYIGWIAIGFSLLYQSPVLWKKRVLIVLSLIQLGSNLAFIDRTRPTWIVFTSIMLLVITSRTLSLKRLSALIALAPVFIVALFILIGGWIGKTDFNEAFKSDEKASVLEGPIYYVSCGFAYLSWASDNIEPSPEIAQRTLYPLYRIWELFDRTKKPPSQIGDFVNVPLPTNVGTLIEPFIRDGGLLFAIAGAVLHSFGFDVLALILRRQGSPIGLFLLANLCFVNFIGFFTPKINTFPIWLFVGLWLLISFTKTINPNRVRH